MTSSDIDTGRRTATISILFCDLVESTERQQHLGDDAADEFFRRFFAVLRAVTEATRGEIVKNTGDGLMVVFRDSAVDALTCASRMHDEVERLEVEPPTHLRVGISAGESAFENNDWWGTPVIEAARLCERAQPAQTLVTDVVRALVGTRGGHTLRPAGSVGLKGIARPVATADVVRVPRVAPKPVPAAPARRRRPWPAISACVALVASAVAFVAVSSRAAAPSGATVAYTPRVETAACSPAVRSLVANATCGALVVPENRARPDGRWIRVTFTRYPSRHEPAAADPVIEIATALDVAEIVDDPFQSPVRDHHELIVFGARGLASARPSLTCPGFAALGPDILRHAENDPATIARGQAALRECHDRLVRAGTALEHYTVLDEAGDVVDLARALHLARVDLQSIWDGARVELAVARIAPRLVRSMLLVDPEVPRSSALANPTTSLGTAFDRYAALCERDRRCHDAYPDLARAYRDDVSTQALRPEVATPVDLISGTLRVAFRDPPVLLDGTRIAEGLAAALTSSLRNVPLIAAGIAHPSSTLDASLALAENFPLVLKDFPWGGFLSRMCSYEIHTRSAGASVAAATRPEFAGYDGPALRWMCAAWPVPEVARAAFAPASSDAPTLVVEQGLDPRGDTDAVRQLRAGLTHMQVLSFATLPGGAAPGDFPACYDDIRRAFVHRPRGVLDTEACARQSPPINFVVPTP